MPELSVRHVASSAGVSRSSIALGVTGLVAVVVGGLVAAVTDPLQVPRGSWLAAYLVLVVGVAQAAMGAGRHRWPGASDGRGWVQFVLWNVGSAAVIVGTVVAAPVVVYAGSVLLLAALVLALLATRVPSDPVRNGALIWIYRGLLVLLLVSVPVGMVLSTLRHA